MALLDPGERLKTWVGVHDDILRAKNLQVLGHL